MKKILFILLFLPILCFSQKKDIDTTILYLPYSVAKQIALDLNRLDSLTADNKLTLKELSETQKKVTVQDSIIITMVLKEKNYDLQIKKETEKLAKKIKAIEDATKKDKNKK